ncbi:hypothetical protein HDU97_000437 [Phlyctochytrium planicorne]|nr:hypothetical protein HDU97_000437 [Phlyctochytrium planicorne]
MPSILEAIANNSVYEKVVESGPDVLFQAHGLPDFPYNEEEKCAVFLDSMKNVGDILADAMVAKHGPAIHASLDSLSDQELGTALGVAENPSWVDETSLQRGQMFFWKKSTLISQILLHMSLAGGFGVPRVDFVLKSTGYLSNRKQAYRRLLETGQMIVDSMEPGELTRFGGKGWRHVLKIRLMHSGVRFRVSKAKTTSIHGTEFMPINQADMNVTMFSFQNAVLAGLARCGVVATKQEVVDYTMTWRYIGWLIGIEDRFNGCQWGFEASLYILYSYLKHYSGTWQSVYLDANPSLKLNHEDSGIVVGCPAFKNTLPAAKTDSEDDDKDYLTLAGNLSIGVLQAVSDNSPFGRSIEYHSAMTRLLVGDKIANKLRLPTTTFYHRFMVYLSILWLRLVKKIYLLPVLGGYLLRNAPSVTTRFLKAELKRMAAKGQK